MQVHGSREILVGSGRCPGEPEVYQLHKRMALSKACFKEDIQERVAETIKKFGMIEPGDKVVIGLSGGKDSYVLLDVLARVHDTGKIIGVSIVEGIPGYNKPGDIEYMRRLASERGVDVVVTSIREYVGHSLYEIVMRAWKRGFRISACTYCGLLRRRIINHYARIYGASKTATAHNLDDEAQTMLANVFRGDLMGLVRQNPLAPRLSDKFIHKIKPLRYVYEYEAALYAAVDGFKFQDTECMFITYAPTFRARIREVLYKLEESYPGIVLNIVQTIDEITSRVVGEIKGSSLPNCSLCGEPTNQGRSICKLCEILGNAGITSPIYQVNLKEYRGIINLL